MARKTVLALAFTLALLVGGAVPTVAAHEHATSATAACDPVIFIPGWGWGSEPTHVAMAVTYSASCTATTTITFSAINPDGKTVWTQVYHHETLSVTEADSTAGWVVKPRLAPGVYTLRFVIASANGHAVYTDLTMGTVTLPLP
jgi:methionine-rich copper-binding protein CopC